MKTLLQEFITDNIKGYKEPIRKGTPKGDPIGPSKIKFEAALRMLTNEKIKDIADKLGVSYQLAKKWRTEPIFKDTLQSLTDQFAANVANYLLDPTKMGKGFIKPLIDSRTYSKDVIRNTALQFTHICTQERYVKMNNARRSFKGWYKLPRKELEVFYELKYQIVESLLDKMKKRYGQTNGMRTITVVGDLDTIYGWLDDLDQTYYGATVREFPTWDARTTKGKVKR